MILTITAMMNEKRNVKRTKRHRCNMKKETTKIKITELKGKQKKGTYTKITYKNKTSYYKIQNNTPIDIYLKYHKDKTNNKKKGTLKQYIKTYQQKITKQKTKTTPISKQATRYLKRIQKTPTIETKLKKGSNNTTIQNIHNTNNQQIHEKTKTLLRTLVLDKKLLEIISTEENLKKIKYRLEHEITITGKNNETLAKATTFNKTIQEVVNELKNTIRKETEMTYTIKDNLKNKKYNNIQILSKGTINKITLKTTYRKG